MGKKRRGSGKILRAGTAAQRTSDEPKLHLARLRRAFFFHEMSRHEGLGTAEARREHARLNSLYEFWSRRSEELEEVAERQGFEAVTPSLRYGRCL